MGAFNPNIPIYIQLENSIKQDIAAGRLTPGSKLPSVRELAEAKTVNLNTVQRAYQELEREGVTETRRGTGTYVVETPDLVAGLRTQLAQAMISTFVGGMRELGLSNKEISGMLETHMNKEKR